MNQQDGFAVVVCVRRGDEGQVKNLLQKEEIIILHGVTMYHVSHCENEVDSWRRSDGGNETLWLGQVL